MIDTKIIDQRLFKIRKNVQLLERVQGKTFDDFIKDDMTFSASLYWLQMSIQAVIDISRYIISDNQWEMPKELKDIPVILAANGVISKEFSEELAGMVGMRNIIAHEYLNVDLSRVYDVIQNHLGDFDEFAKCIVIYMEKEGLV